MADEEIEFLYVKGTAGKGITALWEKNDDHPIPPGEIHGEVFVTDEPAYVALTEKVRVALRLKQLVEVSKKEYDAYWADKDARLKEMATFNSERDLVADPLATVPEIIAERAAFEKQNAERLAESNEPEQKEAEAPKPESTPVTSKKAGAK